MPLQGDFDREIIKECLETLYNHGPSWYLRQCGASKFFEGFRVVKIQVLKFAMLAFEGGNVAKINR